MITFIFLMVNSGYSPYCTAGLNSLQTFSLVAQFLTLFVGIMIIVTQATMETDAEDGGDQGDATDKAVIGLMITVLNGSTLVWPMVRKLLAGEATEYLGMAKSFAVTYPRRLYRKVCGPGGYCGPPKPERLRKIRWFSLARIPIRTPARS